MASGASARVCVPGGGWAANLVCHKVRHDKQERRNAYASCHNGAMARPGFNDEPLGAYFSLHSLAHVLPPSTHRVHIMSKGSFDVTVWIPVGKRINKAVMTASDNAAHLALFPSLLFELPFNGSAGLSIAAPLTQPARHVIRCSLRTVYSLNRTDLFHVCLPTL